MRVLVCGGRDYGDAAVVDNILDGLDVTELCHGGASGADMLACEWAELHGIPAKTFTADWHTFGRAAGPMRNAHMLTSFGPDVVVAFPGGKGTASMVSIAREAGVTVREIPG